MANVEKVISILLDEKNWETLTGIDGVPSFAMDAVVLLRSQQEEIKQLKEKDRLHCEDCAYNGICETPHTDKSPLCAEYSIVR